MRVAGLDAGCSCSLQHLSLSSTTALSPSCRASALNSLCRSAVDSLIPGSVQSVKCGRKSGVVRGWSTERVTAADSASETAKRPFSKVDIEAPGSTESWLVGPTWREPERVETATSEANKLPALTSEPIERQRNGQRTLDEEASTSFEAQQPAGRQRRRPSSQGKARRALSFVERPRKSALPGAKALQKLSDGGREGPEGAAHGKAAVGSQGRVREGGTIELVAGIVRELAQLRPTDDLGVILEQALQHIGREGLGVLVISLCRERMAEFVLKVFEWLEAKGPVEQPLYTVGIDRLARNHQLEAAQRLFEFPGCMRTVHHYGALIGGLARQHGGAEGALAALRRMQGESKQPNALIFNLVISTFCKRPSGFDTALALLDEMESLGGSAAPSLVTYCVLIAACARAGRSLPDEALGLFARLERAGLKADRAVYNALLDVLGKAGRLEAALELRQAMVAAGIEEDEVTLTCLIDACGRRARGERAAALFQEMRDRGLKPNEVTFTALLNAFVRTGETDRAERVLTEMLEVGCRPNVLSWSSLLAAYAGLGQVEAAKQVLQRMQAAGCRPNLVTYTLLMEACNKAGRSEDVEDIFEEMVRGGTFPDVVAYNQLLQAYVSVAEGRRTAAEVMAAMQAEGVRPDLKSYTLLIQAHCNRGEVVAAEAAFASMETAGLPADVVAWNTLLNGYGKAGRYSDARRQLSRMRACGVEPDLWSYTAALSAYCTRGEALGEMSGPELTEVVELLEEMHAAGCRPNSVTYNVALHAFGMRGMWREAELLFGRMRDEGCQPLGDTYQTLMNAFCDGGRPRQAIAVFRQTQQVSLAPTPAMLVCLARACGETGEVQDGGKQSPVFATLEEEGVRVDAALCGALVEALWTAGRQRVALKILAVARVRRGLYPGVHLESKWEWALEVGATSGSVAVGMLLLWLAETRSKLLLSAGRFTPPRLVVRARSSGETQEEGIGEGPGVRRREAETAVALAAIKEKLEDAKAPFVATMGQEGGSLERLEGDGFTIAEWLEGEKAARWLEREGASWGIWKATPEIDQW